MAIDHQSFAEQDKVLQDIEASAGLRFSGIDHIDTSDKHVAELTLPILARWAERIEAPNIRHAIYARFSTPHARRFFRQLLDWWLKEPYPLAVSSLTQAITRLVTAAQAREVWTRYRDQPPKPCHYLLLAKLARLKSSVSDEIKDVLIHDLKNLTLQRQDLVDIAKVDDQRIQALLTGARAPGVRRRTATGQKNTFEDLPGLVVTATPPDRSRELFSTEDDLENLPAVLEQVENQFQLAVPSPALIAQLLMDLRPGKWMLVPVGGTGERGSLAFYLEDVDTFGVVVYSDSPART